MRNVNIPLLEGVRRKVVGVGVVVVIDMVKCSSKRRTLGAVVAPLSSSLSSLKPLPTVSDRILQDKRSLLIFREEIVACLEI